MIEWLCVLVGVGFFGVAVACMRAADRRVSEALAVLRCARTLNAQSDATLDKARKTFEDAEKESRRRMTPVFVRAPNFVQFTGPRGIA